MIVMPNTEPVIDDAAIVDFILRRARDTAIVQGAADGGADQGLGGEGMTEIGLLQEAGAVAFTDGRHAIANAHVLRRALTYARDFDMLVVQHVEEPDPCRRRHERRRARRPGSACSAFPPPPK